MNKKFSDELISAYLDGELTADEQAEVERALLDSADYRRMFDELRTLRQSLQALPRYELDNQFSQRVLRRAERAMLSGSDPRFADDPPAAPVASNTKSAALPPSPENPSPATPSSELHRQALELKRWRRISWASVTVAAASLMIAAAFMVQEAKKSNVAINNRSDRQGAESYFGMAAPRSGQINEPAGAVPVELPLESRGMAGGDNPAPLSADNRTRHALPELAGGFGVEVPAGLPGDALRRDEATASGGGRAALNSQMRSSDATPPTAGAAPPAPGNAARPYAPPSQARKSDTARPAVDRKLNEVSEQEDSLHLKEQVGGPALTYFSEAERLADQDVQVIRVMLTPAEIDAGVFEQVLAKNHIALVDSQNTAATLEDIAKSESVALGKSRDKRLDDKPADDKPDANSLFAEKLVEAAPAVDKLTQLGVSDLEVVLVIAPAEQLKAALFDLAARNGVIPATTLEASERLRRRHEADGVAATDSKNERESKDHLGVSAPKSEPAGKFANAPSPAPATAGLGGGGLGGFKAGASPKGGQAPGATAKPLSLAGDIKAAKPKSAAEELQQNQATPVSPTDPRPIEFGTETQTAQARRLLSFDVPARDADRDAASKRSLHRYQVPLEKAKQRSADVERGGKNAPGEEKAAADDQKRSAKYGGKMVRVLFVIQVAEPPPVAAAAPAEPAPTKSAPAKPDK